MRNIKFQYISEKRKILNLHSCKEHSKKWCFRCLIITAGFPLEHFLWEKAPILKSVTKFLGL